MRLSAGGRAQARATLGRRLQTLSAGDLWAAVSRYDFANCPRSFFCTPSDSGVPFGKVSFNRISVTSNDRGVKCLLVLSLQE